MIPEDAQVWAERWSGSRHWFEEDCAATFPLYFLDDVREGVSDVDGLRRAVERNLGRKVREVAPIRRARVTGGLGADLETVRAYLPSNYRAEKDSSGILILGTDRHGWTLDGYVLPRLQSGLIVAEEVTP